MSKTKKLSPAQKRLLTRASGAPEILLAGTEHATARRLVEMGLMMRPSGYFYGYRKITDAGRKALEQSA